MNLPLMSGMEVENRWCAEILVIVVAPAFLFAEKGSQSLNVPLGLRNWVSGHAPNPKIP